MLRRPLSTTSGVRLGICVLLAMWAQSLCNWANANCIPRVCSRSAVSAMRARTMPSRPRQPSTATIARMLIATSSSIKVSPRIRRERGPPSRRLRSERIRHHLSQLDDAPLRIVRIEYADLDPAECGIGRRQHVFLADQAQLALGAIEVAPAQLGPLPRQANLRQAVFGGPGRHHRCAQIAAVLGQAADRAQTGAERSA